MSTQLVPAGPPMPSFTELAELGKLMASSGYFSDAKETAQAAAKILAGHELGLPPMASMTGVFIVKGRVTLGANLIAALIKRHPRYDLRVVELSNERAEVAFLQDGERLGTSEFTIQDANKAGLRGDNWTHYPRNMLFARAVSNGAKWFVPDVFAGAPVYTPDELGAETDPETGEIVQVVEPPERPSQPEPEPEPQPRSEPSEPEPEPEPEPQPEPEPAAQEQLNSDAPLDDFLLTEDQHKAFVELLDGLGAPESFRRMAAMASGAHDLTGLTRAQARDVALKARERFGETTAT